MATKAEVGKALAATMPGIPSFKPPATPADMDVLVSAYHRQLGHLDAQVIQGAFDLAAGRSAFMPSAGEVLGAAVELTSAPKRTGLDAWGDVKRAIAEHGSYHPPNGVSVLAVGGYAWSFEDALVGKVVAALGWRDLCLSENEMSDRARFIDAYEKEQQRAGEQARLTPDLVRLQTGKRAEALQLMAGLAQKAGSR